MNYLFLSVVIMFLQVAEIFVIAPTLIKRRAQRKKTVPDNRSAADIVLSRTSKYCLYIEMILRGLLIIIQIILAVISKEYSFAAALLLFGVGQILGRGFGALITITSISLLVITHRKESSTLPKASVVDTNNEITPKMSNELEHRSSGTTKFLSSKRFRIYASIVFCVAVLLGALLFLFSGREKETLYWIIIGCTVFLIPLTLIIFRKKKE